MHTCTICGHPLRFTGGIHSQYRCDECGREYRIVVSPLDNDPSDDLIDMALRTIKADLTRRKKWQYLIEKNNTQ